MIGFEDIGGRDVYEWEDEERLEDFEPVELDVASKTHGFFDDGGSLADSESHGGPKYEPRPQQRAMANLVAEALENKSNLCVEAPTGVGKSFAYLVPAIHFAIATRRPVVVSTETIPLQEQLVGKDLPLLAKLLGEDFAFALAKGRSNYICRRRLAWLVGESGRDYLPLPALEPQAHSIAGKVDGLREGDRSELGFDVDHRVWEGICCESGNCSGPKCAFFKGCFYWRARRRWDRADVIVANHALFFTDLKIRSEDPQAALLPPCGALVFDEAHLLEDSAASHLGLRVSDIGLRLMLNKLFDPGKAKGLLMRSGEDALELRKLVSETHDSAEKFFSAFREILNSERKDEKRFMHPGMVVDILSDPLAALEDALGEYVRSDDLDEDVAQEAAALLQRVTGARTEVFDFVNMERAEHVYWSERNGRNRDGIALVGAPLNVSALLRDHLFSKDFPAILTSATLSIAGKLDYYRERVGFINGPEVVLDSPFDYKNQAELHVVRDIPSPSDDGYVAAIADNIRKFIGHTHGKAFVLFTSYFLMRSAADILRDFFHEKGIALHVQGEGASRAKMLEEFRGDVDSVIFGTSSFWMGVDVPGEALSNVIITKLPFAVPTQPLTQARGEKLESEGKSSFMHYQLPEAVLRLKQGVGRLIRNSTDKGIIVILDSRVVTKRYGGMFIDSIPKCPRIDH
jgi:ATP-dependent DNA helicase DinG